MDIERLDIEHPFGEAACEFDVNVLKSDYAKYFMDNVSFTAQALDPKTFLIVGRRGCGKTALTRYLSFQDEMPASCIEVDRPVVFQNHLYQFADPAGSRQGAINDYATVWRLVLWALVFRRLRDRSPQIDNACFWTKAPADSSLFVRHLLGEICRSAQVQTPDARVEKAQSHLDSDLTRAAIEAVKGFTSREAIIVAVDTLEQYDVAEERLMWSTSALIAAASSFNATYARDGVHVKILISGEIYPRLREREISNPTKVIRAPLYLLWHPKDLLRMIAWRFYRFLQSAHPNYAPEKVDWHSPRDVLHKMWEPFFGVNTLNSHGTREASFPYVLRHTQMRPRQLIVLCNAIAESAQRVGSFPTFTEEQQVAAINDQELELANEVINSFSGIYPAVGRILDALAGIPVTFRGSELDRRAKQTASLWPPGTYQPDEFRRLVAELGIVGVIRKRSEAARIIEADFEYSSTERVPLGVHNDCVLHPMFFRRFLVSGSNSYRIYPFPERTEFQEAWT